MPVYHLTVISQEGRLILDQAVDVASEKDLPRRMREIVADAFERPGSFVDFDWKRMTFSIGAGFWSRKGNFELYSAAPDEA